MEQDNLLKICEKLADVGISSLTLAKTACRCNAGWITTQFPASIKVLLHQIVNKYLFSAVQVVQLAWLLIFSKMT